MPKVVFVQGGGIGLDQEASVRRLFDAASGRSSSRFTSPVGRRWSRHEALPHNDVRRDPRCGIALKTKLLAAEGRRDADGARADRADQLTTSRSAAALGLFASVRPVHNLPGIPSRFTGRQLPSRPRDHRGPLHRKRARDRAGRGAEFQDRDRSGLPALLPVHVRTGPASSGRKTDSLHSQGEHSEDGRRAVSRLLPPGGAGFPADRGEGLDRR